MAESGDSDNDEFRSELHNRARESSLEQRRLLISLSTAALGANFIALTLKVDPPLTPNQQIILVVGAVSLAVAVFAGLIAWQADAQRNYIWARALEAKSDEKKKPFIERKNSYARRMEKCMLVLRSAFSIGILAGVVYTIFRVWQQ